MITQKDLKRQPSRAPEKGISTGHGRRGLAPGAGLFLVAAFLVALLIGPAPQAKADFTYRNKITIDKNQVSGSLNHTDFPVLVSVTDNNLKHTSYGDPVADTESDTAGRYIIAKDPPVEDLNSKFSDRSTQTNVDDAGEWILYKRRVNADVYQNINNPDEFQARIHTVPINYWDGEAFKPIDLAIKEVSDGAYKYEMSAAPYQVYLPESLNSPIKLMSQGKHYEFTLKEMSYNAGEDYLGSPYPASAVIDDEKVIYPEAFENIDIEYHLRTWGLKEFFVLKEKPRAPADHLTNPSLDFTEIIDAGDLKMYVDGAPAPDNFTTDKSIEFVDEASGGTVFILPAPYAIDANGEIIQTRYKVQTRGNKVRIHNQTPYSWLNDPERAYPVRIDPSPETITAGYSVVLYGGNTWDTGYISSGDWQGDAFRTGIDFDTSAIPDTATITKVELTLFIDDEGTPVNNDIGNMTKTAYTYHVTDDDKSGFNTDVDGNEYLSDSAGFAGNGSHTVQLLSAAADDLQSQLGGDWFSVGFTGTTEANDKYRDGHDYTEANPPQIIVTYCADGMFKYRRAITIESDLVGTDNTGTLPATGFPVLVNLSGEWLQTTTVNPTNGRIENDNGWDIIFRESDGTTGLYHEIEKYDPQVSVEVLDDWHGNGVDFQTSGLSHDPSPGTDRLVLIAVFAEEATATVSVDTVSLGGVALTKIDEQVVGTGYSNNVWLGYLKDADIPAGTAITVTWVGGNVPDGAWGDPIQVQAATLQNVDQTSPVGNTGKEANASATSIGSSAGQLTVADGDMVVYATLAGNPGNHTAETGYSEHLELDGVANNFSDATASKSITATGTEQPVADWSLTTRLAIVTAVINAADAASLVAWVRIDSLSKSADTTIYMYYGNACIDSPTENPTAVWDDNYRGVWHVTEVNAVDSTQYDNGGTQYNGVTNTASGKIGPADYFADGDQANGDYIDLGNDSSLQITGTLTISAWVTVEGSSGEYMGIAGKLADPAYNGYALVRHSDNRFKLWVGDGDITPADSNTTYTDTNWHYVVGTINTSGTNYLYVDGVQQTDTDNNGLVESGNIAYIGRQYYNYNQRFWQGNIDEVRISNTERSADWIITCHNNQNNPGNYGSSGFYTVGDEESSPATAVNLISFTATGKDNAVEVFWETAREIDNMGFHLYRAISPWGPFTRLTDKLIPGMSFSGMGKTYTYQDTDVTRGQLYYYKLEDIDVYGKRTFHGPICVDWDGDGMPDDWEIAHGLDPALDDSGLDPDGDGLTNLEEYEWETDPLNPDTDGDGILDGDEDGRIDREEGTGSRTLTKGVQILSSDETGITLELRTDAFDMQIVNNEGEAFERLRILGYIHGFTTAVGKPELPMKGILLDIPEGKSATLQVKETEDQTLSGYWVYPVPEKAVQGEGDLAHVTEIFAMDEAAYTTDAFYPNELARLGQTYIFRGQQKLQVLFYPLAFNAGTRELMHYTRIRVRVTYEDAQERSLMAAVAESPGLRALAWTPPSEDSAYKILVSEEGIYRVTRDFLLNNGLTVGDVDGIDLSQVRLYNLGQEVAIYVYDQGGNNQLDAGDYIEFYGRPVETQYAKYATYNVYWLTTSGGSGDPKRMEEIDGTPGSAAVADTHTFTVHHEQDLGYWSTAPGGDSLDRWFFYDSVSGDGIEGGGDPVDFTLSLPGVAGAGTGKLTISMGGYYDTDHEVDVSVNGTPVGTFTWSGIAFYQATMDDVDLLEGDNTVTIECKTSIDTIVVDWFEVEYPRDFAASNDLLKFSFDAGYRYQIAEFTGSDPVAFDITSPGDVQRIAGSTSDTSPCTLYFENPGVTGERTYLALSSDAVETPSGISQDTASTLSDQANGADYILITHTDLGWDGNGDPNPWLSDLVSLREGQGLRVKVVDVADIYDEFSYGIATPQAVKDFISLAYTNWTQPAPLYVLLVGDSTYDAKNNWSWLGQGYTDTTTYLPTYLTFTTSIDYMGETVTDEWFVRVSGDDAIPDMYIGRLPATSVDQAAVMVSKILTYETATNTKTWEKNILLVADNQTEDYEAVFENMNEDAAALIPTGLNVPSKGYLNDYSTGGLRAYIKEKINEGTLMVNYSGHGSTQIWADEHIFDKDDVDGLTNDEKLPFFVSMSCLTGYFAYPETWNFPSLVEFLLRSENGAVAALMPTGMTGSEGQHILDAALFDAIFTEDTRTLGPAVSVAKQTLLANGGSQYEELSETFLLFGDPAMTLKIPLPRRPSELQAQSRAGGVSLSWGGTTDCNGGAVSGYNLYRSTTSGGEYTKVNTSLITGTEHNDTGLEKGTKYYYVVTSVDSDGDKSVRSQEASATPTAAQAGDVPSTTTAATGSGSGDACFISSLLGS